MIRPLPTAGLLAPLFADAAGLLLAFILLPRLATRLQRLGFGNSLLLGLAFALFCLAVYGLKKLEGRSAPPAGLSRLLAPRPLAVAGVIGAVYASFTILYVSGFLDSIPALNRTLLDEPSSTIYLLLTPAAWFGLTLIYALLLSSPIEPSLPAADGRSALVTFLGLSGVNLMLVAGAAVFQALWLRFPPAAPALVFALLLLLHLLVFLPPRLLYLSRRPAARWSLLTFLPLLVFVSWLAAGPAG